MKIHTIFFLSEFVLGGAGNSIYKLCKNLPKKNYQISIICLNKCYYKKLFKDKFFLISLNPKIKLIINK